MKRILDYDPETKTVQFYHENELTGDVALETRQDITAIVEHNKFLYNQFDENARWTDPLRPSVGQTMYARLPTVIHAQLMKITNGGKDQKAFKKWMNDPDNRVFRTRPGRV